jgi:hypothetical protein
MAGKSAIESDVNEGRRRVFQQFLSSFQLQIEQVVVRAVPSRRPKHPDEMNAAVAALVRESLQTQITIEMPHALDYPSQDVSRQSGCAPVVGLRLSLPAQEERPHDQGLRKVFRVQLFGCITLVRIGNEKRHQLLRSGVLEVCLQTQLAVGAMLQL